MENKAKAFFINRAGADGNFAADGSTPNLSAIEFAFRESSRETGSKLAWNLWKKWRNSRV